MEGYVTLAMGSQRYFDMACMLALSLRFHDPARRICLIHDRNISLPPHAAAVFDDHVEIPVDETYFGCANKLRVGRLSPYDRTMFVDADCLLAKSDIARVWINHTGQFFNMTGDVRTSGQWNVLDIAKACAQFDVPYVVQMNSGVFYWERGDKAEAFFAYLNDLYATQRHTISQSHRNVRNQYNDEPFFGIGMGRFGLRPLEPPAGAGSWMVSTWRARRTEMDIARGRVSIQKPAGFRVLGRFWAKRWVQHSPTILHFISLRPARVYSSQCRELVRHFATKGVIPADLPIPA